MGLPPAEFSDSDAWQSIGPSGNGSKVGPNGGPVAQKLPDPGQANVSGDELTPHQMMVIEPEPTGLAAFASSSQFQNFTLFVIVLNGLWIGVDVEWNHPNLKKNDKHPLEPTSTVIENLFCGYFTFEIVVRIFAFGKQNIHDKWFLFDFVLVLFMVIETWIMVLIEAIMGGGGDGILSKFSCLRLLRLTRLTRIMTSLPELLTLVRGMINAARSVGIMLLFLIILMYIFAIVFTAQLGDPNAPEYDMVPYWDEVNGDGRDPTGVELFGSMGDSMMSLFTRGMLGDNLAETLIAIKDAGGTWTCEGEGDDEECNRVGGELWLMWVFILYMTISAFCLLNMLVGVLCEVITETSQDECDRNQISELRRNIDISFRAIDTSGDEKITKTEWSQMREADSVRKSFIRLGVEENFMEDRLDQIEEHLFGRLDKNKILDSEDSWMPEAKEDEKNDDGIQMDKFVSSILEIRPDSPASFLDIHILQTRAERDERIFTAHLEHIERMLATRKGAANDLLDAPGTTTTTTLPPVENTTSVERLQIEGPNTGTSSAPDLWLQGLPTEVLFAELKHRATLQAQNSSVPKAKEPQELS